MDTTGFLILSTKIESTHTKLASCRLLAGKKKKKPAHEGRGGEKIDSWIQVTVKEIEGSDHPLMFHSFTQIH